MGKLFDVSLVFTSIPELPGKITNHFGAGSAFHASGADLRTCDGDHKNA